MLSVIIVSYNTREILKKCLTRLQGGRPLIPMEVIVIDNASTDHSVTMLKAYFPEVRLVTNTSNRGFAVACNQGLRKARGSYILFLNPDCFVQQDALQRVVNFMWHHSKVGICGGLLVNPEGVQQPSARKFPNLLTKAITLSGLGRLFPNSKLVNGHDFLPTEALSGQMETDWVPGAFAMCRREALEEVGGFDERYFLYYEETDLCRAVKLKGWQVYVVPQAVVVHIGGASSKTTNENIDPQAAQITRYRMLSEWLYFRKNHGLLGVAVQAGFEMAWYGLRWLKQRLQNPAENKYSRLSLENHLAMLKQTLMSSRFGSVSPVHPW